MGKPVVRSSLDQFVFMLRHRRMTKEEGGSHSARNVEEAILSHAAARESVSTAEVARGKPVPEPNAVPMPEAPTKAQLNAQSCPKCGAPMAFRTASRGIVGLGPRSAAGAKKATQIHWDRRAGGAYARVKANRMSQGDDRDVYQ